MNASMSEEGVPALELRDLVKVYGQKRAADGVTLTIPQGSMYGFVGPNGAGKTTTMSMVSGILRPDSGEVLVFGQSVWPKPRLTKSMLGVLPEREQMFDRLTGFEQLRYTGLLHGLGEAEVTSRAESLLRAFDLEEARDKLVADYSTGMAKKIGLATALIHAPKLLLLDEPFEAVDPVSASRIHEILRSYIADGGTVIFSSHVMQVVEGLCDHVAVIAEGKIIAEGSLDEVRAGESLQQRFLDMIGVQGFEEGDLSWLRSS